MVLFINGEEVEIVATEVPPNVYGVVDLYGQCVSVKLTAPAPPTALPTPRQATTANTNSIDFWWLRCLVGQEGAWYKLMQAPLAKNRRVEMVTRQAAVRIVTSPALQSRTTVLLICLICFSMTPFPLIIHVEAGYCSNGGIGNSSLSGAWVVRPTSVQNPAHLSVNLTSMPRTVDCPVSVHVDHSMIELTNRLWMMKWQTIPPW